jgi:signal transduction histidine kinase
MSKTVSLAVGDERSDLRLMLVLYVLLAALALFASPPAALRAAAVAALVACPVVYLRLKRGASPRDGELWAANATLRVAALGRREDAKRIRLYRKLVEEVPIGLAILRLEAPGEPRSLRIIEMNPAGLRFAASSEPAAGRTLAEFAPEVFETELPALCAEAIRTGRSSTIADFVSSERVPGGHFSIRIFSLGDSLAGLAFENVSLQAEAQAALARSNADLTQFAYVASHDLQAPLRKAAAFAVQLRSRLDGRLDATDREIFARIERSIDGMQGLIDALLALARVSAGGGAKTAVDLGRLAVEVVDDLHFPIAQSAAKVRVDSLPPAAADLQQMRQLLQNLIGNAVKFHRPGEPPRVRVSGRAREDGAVELRVADDGVGFDMAFAERIFQPFQRLHSPKDYPGNGMGLAICRKIVERHEGTIAVASRPGEGTVFTVVLPQPPRPLRAPEPVSGGASWNRE